MTRPSTEIARFAAPWVAFSHPGFAGPATDLRGASLDVDDGAAYEVRPLEALARAPDDVVEVHDAAGAPHAFVPCAAGATLGELLDESAAQRARVDAAFAVRILVEVAPALLADDAQAISSDHVLVGFDGSVRARGHLAWWGPRRPPSTAVPYGFVVPTVAAESVVLLGIVAAELFTSRRGVPSSFSLPGVERSIRADVRDLVVRLIEGPRRPDREELWNAPDAVTREEVTARIERIRRGIEPSSARDLGVLVQNLFVERARDEQLAQEIVDGARGA